MNAKILKTIEKTLDILEDGFVKRVIQLIELQMSKIAPQVEGFLNSGEVGDFKFPGKETYLAFFKRYIQELFVQGMKLGYDEIEFKRLQYAESVDRDPIIPQKAINWINNWVDHFGNEYYCDVTEDVVKIMRKSLKQGYSVKQTMGALSYYLMGDGYNRARLENIARTNATTAFNQGRLEMFHQHNDFVKAVEYMAILDSRTTEVCRTRDGKIMLLDDPNLPANTPPLHYQCRSILSPIDIYELEDMQVPEWEDSLGEKGKNKTLKDKMNWKNVAKPQKGFGEMSKILKTKAKSSIMRENEFDLQLFAAKHPKNQIEEYIARQKIWKPGDDERLKFYTRGNVNKALYYYNKYLKNGVKAPDGILVNITETDFYKQITDPVFLRQPELIKEILLNAKVKIKQKSGRFMYLSYKPAGYYVVKEITYSVHSLGKGEKGIRKVESEMKRILKMGGEIIWEKD